MIRESDLILNARDVGDLESRFDGTLDAEAGLQGTSGAVLAMLMGGLGVGAGGDYQCDGNQRRAAGEISRIDRALYAAGNVRGRRVYSLAERHFGAPAGRKIPVGRSMVQALVLSPALALLREVEEEHRRSHSPHGFATWLESLNEQLVLKRAEGANRERVQRLRRLSETLVFEVVGAYSRARRGTAAERRP